MAQERNLRASVRRYLNTRKPELKWWPGTGSKGMPDINVIYHGNYYGVELKTKTGRLSVIQEAEREKILAAGGRYVVPRSVEDVRRTFE